MPIPAVIQYPPPRPAPATRGRRANVTPGRWATIQVVRGGIIVEPPESSAPVGDEFFYDIDREEVIIISLMIPPDQPPDLPGLAGADPDLTEKYYLERVVDGVQIGMVRGGTIEPVGGFGYFDPLTFLNYELREDGSFELREDDSLQIRA